uniref:Putative secreted protein n=1 Tax=Anopheles marajoara TaxID=58244 RepID=A0A2M4CC08_9DIPT
MQQHKSSSSVAGGFRCYVVSVLLLWLHHCVASEATLWSLRHRSIDRVLGDVENISNGKSNQTRQQRGAEAWKSMEKSG